MTETVLGDPIQNNVCEFSTSLAQFYKKGLTIVARILRIN